ncbi:MAG: hypothetical protein A2Z11_02175 [Candidatus Woykebacteria bacterium RBG_16_43_9]|uniref:SpoVT-AbrB domain-containing protein n=1 Tax=Candidatus Woykebacteria bacterium RBG_16_43_9 TaxID=1802596 RepID=A0A1G1WGA7_9BACT|nr:MAG: hypothetical protein A2Z11_02175 [Candidatus Woykebacteria bacterium RBG_16_43_9]
MSKKEQWLKVLGKGMLTLPKRWRDESGLQTGDIVKAKKVGTRIVIESKELSKIPYRVYTDAEIDEFIKEDKLTKAFAAKVQKKLSARRGT